MEVHRFAYLDPQCYVGLVKLPRLELVHHCAAILIVDQSGVKNGDIGQTLKATAALLCSSTSHLDLKPVGSTTVQL